MELETQIVAETDKATVSVLKVNGRQFCFILEDGHKDVKVWGQTRIPRGRYRIIKRTEGTIFTKQKQRHGFEFVPHIIDVPNYQYILIHIGNKIEDTLGCLLTGESFEYKKGGLIEVKESTSAFKRLHDLMKVAFDNNEEVWITLHENSNLLNL
jgi:hypothetical protein